MANTAIPIALKVLDQKPSAFDLKPPEPSINTTAGHGGRSRRQEQMSDDIGRRRGLAAERNAQRARRRAGEGVCT
jgi:hypothetical protein